jgi:oxalate decarboxylase
VVAKNFEVPRSAFDKIPREELYIFPSEVPGKLAADKVVGAGAVPKPFSHRLMDQATVKTKGGRVRIVDATVFPATTSISAALVEVEPGGMRELHWHPNSDEMQYYIAGESRMTVYASGATASTFDYQPGDVGYVPRSMPHYIENTGKTVLRYLEVWKSNKFSDVSLRQWLGFTPFELVLAHLKIDKSVLKDIPTRKTPVLPV